MERKEAGRMEEIDIYVKNLIKHPGTLPKLPEAERCGVFAGAACGPAVPEGAGSPSI